jgi:Lipocalin-like domain
METPVTTIEPSTLFGTWKLIAASATGPDGQAIGQPYGPVPMGRLVLTPEGRMMAVLCDGRPSIPDGQKRAYSSYCGNFSVEENILITIVDAASDAGRIGSAQRRKLALRDGKLVLTPPPRLDGEQRELIWERER